MFEKAMEVSLSTQVFNLWITAIVSALSAIWFVRNQGHFGNVFIPLARSLAFVWASIREANALQKGTMHNSIGDLLVLRNLGVTGAAPRAPQIIPVVWSPPPMGWLKVNTDGAADGCPGPGGCGGYFVTSRGFIKGSFVVPLDSCYAFESELLGAITAIECARDFGWDHLWLECDSTYVANLLIRREEVVPWAYKSRWVNCLSFISNIQFRVSHIFREGNTVADALSKIAVSSPGFQWWWGLPDSCSPMHYRNVNGFPNYRFRK